jgi:hypothetical protein
MKMKHVSSLLAGVLTTLFTTTKLQADDILIYKASSARTWTAYASDNPKSTSLTNPAIPKSTLLGKYTNTDWWIINRTNRTLQRINYFIRPYVEGAKEKAYVVYDPRQIGDAAFNLGQTPDGSNITQMILKDKAANSFRYFFNDFYEFSSNTEDIDGDGELDATLEREHQTLTGSAKKLTISPTVFINQVPSTITGPWMYLEDTKYLNADDSIDFHKQLFEIGNTTVRLDTAKTKSVMIGPGTITSYRGGPALSFGTQDYAVALIENELYKLGFDYQQ